MLSNTASADTPTCLTLIGPSNFQIWKLQITAKLWREKVLVMAMGTDTCPIISLSIPGTTTAVPRVHRIIRDSISNALLLKTEMHTTTQDLFNILLSIHQASNLTSAFYIFQQLFNSTWSRGSTIFKHITSLQTLEACLARMKFAVNTRLLTFVLLNSLLKTPEWNMFTSSVINTIEDSKLTFDTGNLNHLGGGIPQPFQILRLHPQSLQQVLCSSTQLCRLVQAPPTVWTQL
ncbi:hypothetical protein PAXRUDRAFT_154299 [Paxillus rubicundulus Ve08.2h10]|uniref:Uncharacterized protein n=1 Tax=Paxillus rubicundulus Ve08.2h10 TaxID=930991 RepID=A0A0D0D2B5_9AGAM|nr:hypothetical protein PAXRUDRAFT_154299 [Paxillus rubicundulus Ve08.2h10]